MNKSTSGSIQPNESLRGFEPGDAPPWRVFRGEPLTNLTFAEAEWERDRERGRKYRPREGQAAVVRASLTLRRPLLVTGRPGTGKSSLAYWVASELALGPVLRWPITSRTTLLEGLYRYDAVGRLQDTHLAEGKRAPEIGKYIQLGPLGTALIPRHRPRVLIVDELDKSSIDFPSDLLHVFEEGEFEIPELARMGEVGPVWVRTHDPQDRVRSMPRRDAPADEPAPAGWTRVVGGTVQCKEFPFVVITSNGERDFPAPFLRRCLRFRLQPPDVDELGDIVESYFNRKVRTEVVELIRSFDLEQSPAGGGQLATDQLLNAVLLRLRGTDLTDKDQAGLREIIFRSLSESDQ